MPDTSNIDENPAEQSTGQVPADKAPADKPSRWSAVGVLAVVFAAILVSQTLLRREPPVEDQLAEIQQREPVGEVTLAFDRGEGEGAEEISVVLYPEMTVLSATRAAVDDWGGALVVHETGQNAFVVSLGGLENEGRTGRNWEYFVNGDRAVVSAGVRELAAGDRILWKFKLAE